jgi:hypothetical protein
MRLAKNPLEEGVRCEISDQDVEFKKLQTIQLTGLKTALTALYSATFFPCGHPYPLVGSNSIADRKAFFVKFF